MRQHRISHSSVKLWRRCRRAYHYKYNMRLDPRRVQRPLVFGRVVHSLIEADANAWDDPFEVLAQYRGELKKLFAAEREAFEGILEDAELIMREYFDYWADEPLTYVRRRGRGAEHKFEVELPFGRAVQTGKIDAVAKSRGRRWLVEHKTGKNIPNEDQRWRDIQTVLYKERAEAMGFGHLDGVCWDYIRSKPPSRPELLKSGGLSKKSIDTLPSVYLREIERHQLDPADYEDILEDLRKKRGTWFSRVFMPFNSSIVEQLNREFEQTAKEIVDRSEHDHTRNITRDCSWCSFESICRAELRGLDVDHVIKTEYRTRAEADAVEEPVAEAE